jgi:hypothetical protein
MAAQTNLVCWAPAPHLLYVALRDGGPPAKNSWAPPIRARVKEKAVGLSIFRRSPLTAGSSKFEVLEADFGRMLWTVVRSLGDDLALFVGRGCSRAVCVSPYDLSRDSIFFVDDYPDPSLYWKKKQLHLVVCMTWKTGRSIQPGLWYHGWVETSQ